ncbi:MULTISPECIES: hypothetical protein [unclassified Microcoleus]|uniref:hypothetical protein n=1 Tax=unclassified Microcoleus TaxID=2642155 RepID=UPI001DEA1718|nr:MULTISPECIES: hypothetical protein [unclassified Microcoleus]MCC3420759.1 hypothetical protein [Microcoleus sp. PH2017_07_MST_O_A]MCC3508863.1 hypothetical protein [Microcoleus sp. PH2017_17_BER_D_A]TAE12672.1 MAG: hypothetical protein EAZ94_12180 [Oscillatoriales cyanobacterium]MCC3412510.1 hypothetical protein [Microcoleus sp. PH2017_02_FOX_O_A]MCC3426112.1 hypothetical protein [Microcoleus sp. PH2017_01_SCD_O_A]
MTRQLSRQNHADNEPFYGKFWNNLKRFPKSLAEGAETPPSNSGPAAAALISAGIGCFVMMVTHHLSDTSKATEKIVWNIGSWIPGSKSDSELWGNIGSYTGKETMLLVGWLISWPILYAIWKNKSVKSRTIFFWMFALLVASTAMSWHPLFPYLPLI